MGDGSLAVRVLITGSRSWTDDSVVHRAIDHAIEGVALATVTIVHGDCPTGADSIAKNYARSLGVAVEGHPAEWGRHGRRAGYLRNAAMVNSGADVCLAFPLGESRGTRMTMKLASQAGIIVVDHEDVGHD